MNARDGDSRLAGPGGGKSDAPGPAINVLHTVRSLTVNGISSAVIRTVAALDPTHVRSHVCAIYDVPHMAAALRARGVEPHVLRYRGLRSAVPAVLRLARLIRSLRIDVVHANQTIDFVLAGAAARICGVPVVSTLHWQATSDVPKRRGERTKRLIRLLADRSIATCIVAVSEETRRSFSDLHGARFPSHRVHVVHPGIDIPDEPSREATECERVREQLGLQHAWPVLVNVGRLDHAKGQEYLLPMMRAVLERYPNARLLIVGDGALRDPLTRAISAQRLEAAVHMLGQRLDVDSLLALADIAVFASVTEATPLSVLEAARAAKPVVATRVGALAEMVEDGSTGYLVEPRDATALASAVLRMLDTPGAVAAMGARARRLVERKFDIAKSARALEQLYASLAGLADRHPGG